MRIITIDKDGVDFIKGWEEFRSKPYLDQSFVPTIGYGSTYYEDGKKVKLTDPEISEFRATQLFDNTLMFYMHQTDVYVRDDVNQNQFNALVSFCYNEGPSGLKGSTLLRKINTDLLDPTIHDEFIKWVYVRRHDVMVKSRGLYRRRVAESQLYFKEA